MSEPEPVVRVGIVSWNTADELDRCLSALPAALAGLPAEVVVVDNASSDASAERAGQHTDVRVIRNAGNEGYARAMNKALADTVAPVLIALNPDTTPPPGSLRQLAETLLRQPDLGLVAPRLSYPDGSPQHSVNRFPSVALTMAASLRPASWHARHPTRWWVPGVAPHDTSGDIDWAIGAVHVLRAEAFGGRPPYSERWFMYAEDLELCWRLQHAGWRRHLLAEVTVAHRSGAATAKSSWAADPARRWLPCSYDFYARAHSGPAARVWAGANALAFALWSAIGVVRPGWLPFQTGGRRAQLRQAFRLRHHLWIHLTALVAGPRVMARRAARLGGADGAVLIAAPRPTELHEQPAAR